MQLNLEEWPVRNPWLLRGQARIALTLLCCTLTGCSQPSSSTNLNPAEIGVATNPIIWSGSTFDSPAGTQFTPTFILKNEGKQPVDLLSAESSCGCATPSFNPTRLLPGDSYPLKVSASLPVSGAKHVSVTVQTRPSTAKPLVLKLSMTPTQTPPYIAGVSGVINFATNKGASQTCDITVFVVDTSNQDYVPLVSADIPYITTKLISTRIVGRLESGIVHREMLYQVGLVSLPSGTQEGNVSVIDPGCSNSPIIIPITIMDNSNIRILNPSLVLSRGDDHNTVAEVKLIVRLADPESVLEIDPSSDAKLFRITQSTNHSTNGLITLTIQERQDLRMSPGQYTLRLRTSNGDSTTAVLTLN